MATGRLPDPNTAPLTAKGDLYTYSTVPARLAVGNNGDTLVADSSQTTGLRYNPPVGSLANPVINGGMDIWQRGTSISVGAGAAFGADRWQGNRGTNATGMSFSRQTTSDTTNLPNIQYSLRVQRDSGNTSTAILYAYQNVETVNTIPFAGKPVTLSFYARRGANFSQASNLLSVTLFTGTGTDQNINGVYTGASSAINNDFTLTTTWQRFVLTGTIPTTATEMAIFLAYTPTGTAGANDWYEITGVQIDVGTWTASTAPTFRRSGGTLAGELAACQRYFERVSPGGAYGSLQSPGFFTSTTNFQPTTIYKVTKRGVPTFGSSAANTFLAGAAGANFTPSAIALSDAGLNSATLAVTVSGATAGQGATLVANNNTGAYIEFSAEL